jgi:hypothetical protein
MTSVLHHNSNVMRFGPFEGIANLVRRSSVDDICGIVPDRTASRACINVFGNAGTIRVYWIARVISPDRIVDADWILCVPC